MKITQLKQEGIRIVKFEPSYAASVAEMWNLSTEGWNGEYWDMTEEKVLREEVNSESIALYLAVDEKENVLGFCKLEEYDDKKAVYISLLNVRPSHWGKRIGKALLFKALQVCIELGYERLDLHSWSGNTKAVPLYKKCGFRWQSSTASMYMMNYLPYIFKQEALEGYFGGIDWYQDAECDLRLEPDGRMENEFELFDYSWSGINGLQAVFEAGGKGLCQVRTADFGVKLVSASQKAFFGKNKIELELTNKTSTPLEVVVQLQGENGLECSEERSICVSSSQRELFWVRALDDYEICADKKAAVTANLKINGKSLELKLSLEIAAPVKLELIPQKGMIYKQGRIQLALQMKNNRDSVSEINALLPESDELSFEDRELFAELEPGESQTRMLNVLLKKGCYYNEQIVVKTGDIEADYRIRLQALLPDLDTVIKAQDAFRWILQMGSIKLYYSRKPGDAPVDIYIDDQEFWYFFKQPRLGAPYDKEFMNEVPQKVTFADQEDGIILKAEYLSRNGSIRLASIFHLSSTKILSHSWEIKNISEQPLNIPCLDCGFDLKKSNSLYNDKILKIGGQEKQHFWLSLDEDLVAPGWVYYQNDGKSLGVCWDSEYRLKFNDWWQSMIIPVGDLQSGEQKVIKGEVIYFDHFKNWQSFYRWYFGSSEYPLEIRKRELLVNQGNPFCEKEIKLQLKDLVKSSDKKKLTVLADKKSILTADYTSGGWQTELPGCSNLSLVIEDEASLQEFKNTHFAVPGDDLMYRLAEREGHKVQIWESEKIKIVNSPEFKTGIFSLKYEGVELLSSSWPASIVRGWSSRWYGGLYIDPWRVSDTNLEKQNFLSEKAVRKDNFGNIWKGFSITVTYDSNLKKLEGITARYNYLISPSHNVVACFAEVCDTGGRYIDRFLGQMAAYFTEATPVEFLTAQGKYKTGERTVSQHQLKTATVNLREKGLKLHYYPVSGYLGVVVGNGMGRILHNIRIEDIRPGKLKASSAVFLVISSRHYSEDQLKILKNIKWS